MRNDPLIRVALTTRQWNALQACVVGELESLQDADWKSGAGEDLAAALKNMEAARKARANRMARRGA